MPTPVPLVTRGFGPVSRVVTTGYGPFIKKIIEAVKVYGSKGVDAIRRLPNILYTVRAYFTGVNDTELLPEIMGDARKVVDPNVDEPRISADLSHNQASKSTKEIFISASRSVRTLRKNGD